MELDKYKEFISKYSKRDGIDRVTKAFLNDCKKMGFKKVNVEPVYDEDEIDIYLRYRNIYDIETLGNYLYTQANYIYDVEDRFDLLEAHEEYRELNIILSFMLYHIHELSRYDIDNVTRIVIETKIDYEDKFENQKLTLYKTGKVKLFDVKEREEYSDTISKNDMADIYNKLNQYFSNIKMTNADKTVGFWSISFFNKRDELRTIQGGYGETIEYDGINLTEYIQELIENYDAIIFDGYEIEDKIDYLSLILGGKDDSTESLYIDYSKNYLEYYISHNDGTVNMHHFDGYSVRILLDNIYDDVKQLVFKDDSDYVNDDAHHFILKIKTIKEKLKVYEGYYDKQGLSDNWPAFIAEIYHYMATYRDGDIFDPNCFTKRKKADDEYMVVNVAVKDVPQEYYYLCEDENVNITDIVVVPFGYDDSLRLAQIIDIDYLKKEDLPLPLEEMKYIDHIAEREDFTELDDDYEVDHRLH